MSIPEQYAATNSDYRLIEADTARAVNLRGRLPAWPFVARSGFASIFEFDYVLGDFGRVLEQLARVYCDKSVLLIGLEPRYYEPAFGVWPALRFDSCSVRERYWETLYWEPGTGVVGNLGDTLNVLAIAGSSGKWGVWGQRDWEVGLLLTPDRAGPWCDEGVRFFGRDLDLDDIRGPEGWTLPLTEDMLAEFWGNFDRRGMG